MPPDQGGAPAVSRERSADKAREVVVKKPYKMQIKWINVAYFTYFHLAAVYGLYLALTSAKLPTLLFSRFHILFIPYHYQHQPFIIV